MAGSSDKSIALDTENVRDIGATYTVGYSNATGRQKLRSQRSALGSDQPNDGLAAELAVLRYLSALGPKRPIRNVRYCVAIGGKADVTRTSQFGSD